MTSELWLAVLATALGTYLMRLLPLLWMRRRLRRSSDEVTAMPQWLSLLGPLMIAALTGVSLVPHRLDATSWLATAVGILVTLSTWHRTRSLGWPVALGVVAYGVVIILGI